MRRLCSAIARESGQAMVLAVFTFALLATVAVTLTNVVTDASVTSGQAVARDTAYEAAEAGIDEYISKLLDDPLYYQHYVDAAESTRGSGALTVGAGGAWTGGITWSYPNGKDTWKQIGNGYAYNLELTGPSGSGTQFQEAVQILSTGCRWNTTTSACTTGTGYAEREIQTVLLPSSVASWQMISNQSITYGATATTNGRVYANGNITHYGTATANLYASGTVGGPPTLQNGAVAYDKNSTPSFSTEITNPINFSSFQTSISDIQRAALSGGVDLTQATPPAAWQVVFLSNGTFTAAPCALSGGLPVWENAPSCGTATTYTMPSNGAIYSDQTVIIGSTGSASTVNGRVTVTSGADIVIGNNITYQPGSNSVLGLNADVDMVVAAWVPGTSGTSPTGNLTVDAALIAQTGQFTDACGEGDNATCQSCGGSCSYWRQSVSFNGSVATDLGGSMSTFETRSYNFDPNLLWLDPPWFPMIENPYTVLLEREIPPS